MTSPVDELLCELSRHGGRLVTAGDDLEVEAPAPLPGELMLKLRAHKPELIRRLSPPRNAPAEVRPADRTEGRAALELLNRSGVRLLTHRRAVAIPRASDGPGVRAALAMLGYGGFEVRHLARPMRGASLELVEAALLAAEKRRPC